jgi:hypothetical protein
MLGYVVGIPYLYYVINDKRYEHFRIKPYRIGI